MIPTKSAEEIEKMRRAGRITALALAAVGRQVRAGVTTAELDRAAELTIEEHGADPAFKGYRGYPATTCISINEEVVHGIPGPRQLKPGDIIGVDVGAYVDGFYGDCAFTFAVEPLAPEVREFLGFCRKTLDRAIGLIRPGIRLGEVSNFFQTSLEKKGYAPVRALVGHGIGRQLHEEPPAPNFGSRKKGPTLRSGMTLAIEPMVNMGTWEVDFLDDGWTVVTRDRKLSCHFEHTVAVTDRGSEVLTLPQVEWA